MYDVQRIGKIIADLQRYMNDARSYKIEKVSDLEDKRNYYALSMVIFAILNRLLDLGNEIISAEELGAPEAYDRTMSILAKANVINNEKADSLNKLIARRNVLAHFYEDITEKDLFAVFKELYQIEDFIKTIKKRVKI
ncbi:DUF86 domain-containing protein [Candidatus Pacearchaeota archaeon]|nr:DUF86 domain-containing protein [Candidatus Pacearchaeota archaeon]